MGDSVATEHTMFTEHIVAIVEPSASDYTAVVAQTAIAIVAMVQTTSAVQVVVVPPVVVAAVAAPFYGPLPSRSTCPSFYPGVDHMRDNLDLHAQQIGKICSTNSLAS